ncbi:MAG: polyprenyl diphosphate synthase [Candidatus Omnitrophota bacterium]
MKVPKHVAIVMDGNGRWAKAKGLPRVLGHRQGAIRVEEIVEQAKRMGVKVLTVFAFSTENWDRPKEEIETLFSYLCEFLQRNKNKMIDEGVRLLAIGQRGRLNDKSLKELAEIEDATASNFEFTLIIALDYGGRWDIVQAARNIASDVKEGKLSLEDVNEEVFGSYLSLSNVGCPDLFVRTSGELRISNFLLWDLAYAEFYFTDVFWPDFTKDEFEKAVKEYSSRDRRFGKV